MQFKVTGLSQFGVVIDHIVSLLEKGYHVILLEGDLGAGKTTFSQQLCKHLGVTEPVSSPTFSLVNEYVSPQWGTIYHMDLYRLEKPGDLVQIGLEEYLESGQPCLIEWPGIAEPHFVMPHIRVHIHVEPDQSRIFNITTHDAMDT
jgi:tRNA threonylcarbamoyladenosine biosynthesis protein TsaE